MSHVKKKVIVLKSKGVKISMELMVSQREATKIVAMSTNIRNEIIAYAQKFEGNPYVWGGTSLTKGADCSGFTQTVFKDKGIKIPRTSRMQAADGREIDIKSVMPGDLIFYGKDGTINHVAIYLGEGKVISASSKKTGIRITKYDYRQPYKVVSYIKDN